MPSPIAQPDFSGYPPDAWQRLSGDVSTIRHLAIRFRWWLLVLVVVANCLGILYLHTAAHIYASSAIVGAKVPEKMPQVANLLRQFGGGAGLNKGQEFNGFVEVLRSPELFQDLAQKPEVMTHVFAAEWDEERQEFGRKGGFLRPVKDLVKDILAMPPYQKPDGERLRLATLKQLSISFDTETGFVRLSFRDRSPEFAKKYLTMILYGADRIVRKRKVEQAQNRIDLLRERLDGMGLIDQRTMMLNLMSEEMNNLVTAQVDNLSVAEIISEPLQPVSRSSPQSLTTMMLANLIAGVSYLAGILILTLRRRQTI